MRAINPLTSCLTGARPTMASSLASASSIGEDSACWSASTMTMERTRTGEPFTDARVCCSHQPTGHKCHAQPGDDYQCDRQSCDHHACLDPANSTKQRDNFEP